MQNRIIENYCSGVYPVSYTHLDVYKRQGEETVWYYAHEQDKVKRLCNDLIELLEKKLANYLNQR